MVFDAFRIDGGPTQHQIAPVSISSDTLHIGSITAFITIFLCFIFTLPGYRGLSRIYFIVRLSASLFIGCAIIIGVVGQHWESGSVLTTTPYKAFTYKQIKAHVGIKIGLKSINVTFKGEPIQQLLSNNSSKETIDYNERFSWDWRQGRPGFGPYAGKINKQLRFGQQSGLPLPILWVVEYFVFDGELVRWGRNYRTSGWYTNEVLWTSFVLWIIANILSVFNPLYAGGAFFLTGALMLTGTIIWTTLRLGYQPLIIPFEDSDLRTTYGADFWLVVSGGLFAVSYALIIILMNKFFGKFIHKYFNIYIESKEEFAVDDENSLGTDISCIDEKTNDSYSSQKVEYTNKAFEDETFRKTQL